MRLKAILQNKVTKALFSVQRRDSRRRKAERVRQAKNHAHLVEYFHEAGDPYSHLMVQLLPEFVRRFDVDLRIHVVPPPPDWAAPDRARLDAYARKDCERLAARTGLNFSDPGQQPSQDALTHAQTELIAVRADLDFLTKAKSIGEGLWRLDTVHVAADHSQSVTDALTVAAEHRDALGHYLGGTLYYAGEWYWGPDRLHFLESRLRQLNASKPDAPADLIFPPPMVPAGRGSAASDRPVELHWYLSFRSPYTGIVRDRVKDLAEAYGAELKLRYVLPMVMRGMKVPRQKGFYIMSDTVREAERLGVSFGNSMDPVGRPVERGYAILHEAIRRGRGYEFAQSFLAGVWAEGIDAGSDKGLRILTERAGLPWIEMQPLLGKNHWRAEAEANQQEMFDYGLWGVPSFRVGDVAVWGQDRLWVIEDALRSVPAG